MIHVLAAAAEPIAVEKDSMPIKIMPKALNALPSARTSARDIRRGRLHMAEMMLRTVGKERAASAPTRIKARGIPTQKMRRRILRELQPSARLHMVAVFWKTQCQLVPKAAVGGPKHNQRAYVSCGRPGVTRGSYSPLSNWGSFPTTSFDPWRRPLRQPRGGD